MLKRIAPFLFLILATIVLSCGGAKKTRVIKLGHVLNEDHPVHLAMVVMAEKIKEKSKGTLVMDIYPSGQLGSERELLELLQVGSLGMTKVSAASMEGFAPKFKVLSLPYLFNDEKHYWSVLNGAIGQDLLSEGEKFWLKGICFYDAGARSFYTVNKPIETPEDLKGLKVRVMNSQTSIAMVDLFEGSATPISFGELYTALQQGMVDGAENNPPSFYLSRHYEVAKYYSLNEHSYIPDLLVMSTHVWNSLSEQEQKWVKEAAMESVPIQIKLWKESVEESLLKVQEAGVKVIRPDKILFAKRAQILQEEYKKGNPEIADLINRIQKEGENK